MDFWIKARRSMPRGTTGLGLPDLVVLSTISRYGGMIGRSRYVEGGTPEASWILKGILVLVCADLKRSGHDMDLSLEFKDPDAPDGDIVESASIAQSLGFLKAHDLIVAHQRGTGDFRATGDGSRALAMARHRLDEPADVRRPSHDVVGPEKDRPHSHPHPPAPCLPPHPHPSPPPSSS